MTHQEILETAIQKAMGNGWMPDSFYAVLELPTSYRVSVRANGRSRPEDIIGDHYYRVIFDHGFARALWGGRCVFKYKGHIHEPAEGSGGCLPAYLYHLQGMVTEADPIAYLGEHLSA